MDELMSTSDVAAEAGISETEARAWAELNGVARVSNIFVWTSLDLEDFIEDLTDEDDEDDEDESDDD